MDPEAPVFSYSTTTPTVTGRDGNAYAIASPLVDSMVKPRQGWRARFSIKGHTVVFDGRSARDTFDKVTANLRANQIEFTELDVWLNLNIQWTGRVAEQRRLKVTQADLLAVAAGNPAPRTAHKNRANTPPMVWGRKAWGMLQMYLALDTYEPGRFLLLASEIANWVNPDTNPSTGCADCFRHYTAHLEKLRRKTLYTQDEARRWLFEAMNDVNKRVGKKVFTYEEAAQANHWI